MTLADIQTKVAAAIADACRTRLYGVIEIEFKAGAPVFLRKHATEKLDDVTAR
jgi:hypothetical protein